MSIGFCIRNFLRAVFLVFVFLGFSLLNAAEDLQVFIHPNPVLQNQRSTFMIIVPGGEDLREIHFPKIDGIEWSRNATVAQTHIVNGVVTRREGYNFTVSKTGTVSIPKIRVVTNKGERYTQAVSFTVGKASSGIYDASGAEVPLEKALILHIQPVYSRKSYFVGEDIPVQAFVLSPLNVSVNRTAVPQLRDGSKFSLRSERPPVISQQPLLVNNEPKNAVISFMKLRGMEAGTFDVEFSAVAPCSLLNSGRRSDPFAGGFGGDVDDIFDNFFNGRRASPPISVNVHGVLSGIEIKNRPQVPEGVVDLGVITERPLQWSFSNLSPKQGEPFYLDFQISGNPSGFKTPEISLEGFRTYPAEVEEIPANQSAEALIKVRQMLIPLNAGTQTVSLKLALLNPESGNYKIFEISQDLEVQENKDLVRNSMSSVVLPAKEEVFGKDILYIRHLDSEKLLRGESLKSMAKMLEICVGVIAALLAYAGGIAGWLIYREKKQNSPKALRIARAREKKKDLIRKLEMADEGNFYTLVRTEVEDYFADAAGTASFDELRPNLKNKDVAKLIGDAETAGYTPGARCENLEALKKMIIGAIKRGSFLLVLGFCLFSFKPVQAESAGLPKAEDATELSSTTAGLIGAAEDDYAAGKFIQSVKAYEELLGRFPHSSELWFNLGNTYYQTKAFPKALLCYERAYRLALCNQFQECSFILSNLNATRMQLGLPLRNEVKTPVDFFFVLRDSFSRNAWLIGGVSIFAILIHGVLFFALIKRRKSYAIIFASLAIGVPAFAFFNAFWQERELFNEKEAIVMQAEVPGWNLPIAQSAKKIAVFPIGQSLLILEERESRALVRTSTGTEAWLDKNAFARVWGDFTVPEKR